MAGAAVASLALASGSAEAVVLIEGFESGLPAGSVLAPGSIGGTSGSVTNLAPTEGAAFGFLTTEGIASIPGGTGGSALLLPAFSLAADDVLLLDLNFLTNDGNGFNDFALVLLLDSVTTDPVAMLYTANTTTALAQASPCLGCPPGDLSPGVTLTPSPAFFDGVETGPLGGGTYGPGKFGGGAGGASGWVTSSYLPGAGSYQLYVAVSNVDDTEENSALAFDSIRFDSRSEPRSDDGHDGPVVPEPNSLLLMSFGAFCAPICRRRRLVRR